MPPFRIVVRHPDKGHHDNAWAQLGPLYDAREDADEVLAVEREHAPVPTSLEPEERVRLGVEDRLAEFDSLGYESKVQELVVKATGTDDAGATVPVEHRWKDVS